jgi:hypothetical protein
MRKRQHGRRPLGILGLAIGLLAYTVRAGAITYQEPILLSPPDTEFSFDLGNAVAVWGDRIVVGDSQSRRFLPDVGAAYLFDSSGALLLTFRAPGGTPDSDNFGKAVAIQGSRVVISDNADDFTATDHGRAYLFDTATCDVADTVPGDAVCDVPALQFRNPDRVPGGGPQFGFSAGIDGDLVVFGAPNAGSGGVAYGVAYVFDIASCDADGDRVCDGPAARLVNPTPDPQPVGDREFFARAVAISGSTVLVGARFDDAGGNRNGAAYLFHLAPCGVNLLCALAPTMLPNPVPETESEFGHSVALRGSIAVVGAPGATVVRPDGTVALHGGKAYSYDFAACVAGICPPARELRSPTAFDNDRFGEGVAVSGGRVLVGSPFDNLGSTDRGAGYLYDLDGCDGDGDGICGEAEHTFANPGPITLGLGQAFGEAVALDGTTVVIGARQNDHGGGNRGSAHLFVAGNMPPVAADDSHATDEDTALVVAAPGVLANDSDPDGDPITVSLVGSPASGTLTLNADGSFSYVPDGEFSGTDSFTYRVNDGTADSGVATVTIAVSAVNDVPGASPDAYSTPQDATLSVAAPGVLENDTDIEGPLSAILMSGPAHGTLALNADGAFTYTPAAGFSGSDSFTYQASDGAASSAPAVVSLTVVAAPTDPAGRMMGAGRVIDEGARHSFAFHVRERRDGVERGGLIYEMRRDDAPRRSRPDRFVATSIAAVAFSDAPAIRPARRPVPVIDTAIFSGTGWWNGQPNHAFEARAVDAGEPGRGRDEFAITITAPGGDVVATVSGLLSAGNVQSARVRR